ncbi:sigma-70 family RNA polymerase sigma factor [Chromobacterium subtsugae]|uniref:sigma-70 family RNA polymerase sigma factor n=1 Tax=Chromobacterium subtsugae TaxID=251747 RepID=UPI0009B5BF21|nr:sigma-70 family RNA polymerase sigma factor [Chromobacterium subtsugae]
MNRRENGEGNDDQPFEDEDEVLSEPTSVDDLDDLDSIRPEVVEKVFKALSADAQRGDSQLQRSDVNRAYLRKNLSIAECMAVEDRILAAGYQVLDEDETDGEGITGSKTYHYLTEVEEKDFGRQIQLALRIPKDTSGLDPTYVDRILGDAERAKAAFVVSNIRFVEQLARRFGEHQHLSLEDVIQEGVLGLLHAADLYNPERGFRFKTYAAWWIEQRMRRAIGNCDRTIRLPIHVQQKMAQIKKAKKKLTLTCGRPPTLEELAIAVGMEQEKLMKLLWHVETTDCAEGDVVIREDSSLLSFVADSAESVFDTIVHQELKERFRHVLATLTPQEAHIVRMRFGIDVDREYTLESLGKDYNVTRERIRQVEAKALKKLCHPIRKDQLSDFIDL